MMFWEGLTAISAPKRFQIKFINIAIYCNNFFDIAIYRNTFLGPQYPALANILEITRKFYKDLYTSSNPSSYEIKNT